MKKINENSLVRHQNWNYDLIWGYLKKLEETLQETLKIGETGKKPHTLRSFASRAKCFVSHLMFSSRCAEEDSELALECLQRGKSRNFVA